MSGLSLINYTSGDLEWQGALADYRTKSVGDTKYFYKNNGVTGTVDLSEGEELGYVGHVVFASEENGTYYIARRSGNTYNVTVYNYEGTELKSFSGLDDLNGFYLGSKFVTYDRSESVEIYKIA